MLPDERIDRLEERLAWLERHVLEQDKAMLQLTEENLRLKAELALVTSRMASSSADGSSRDSLEQDERPPHY